jgi:DNA-binding winged helix-turn-helix (wHTH) protein/tetratricopeptide (TPR) repeat protein
MYSDEGSPQAAGDDVKEFSPFRLDTVNQCVWEGEKRILLRPKAFSVLTYLVEHAGRLVTQNELLEALWPDTFVQPEVLKSHILEVRAALGDRPKAPRFIETRPRRGYRFIQNVTEAAQNVNEAAGHASIQPARPKIQIIGRERELAKLRDYLNQACAGELRIVFVTGEGGIGKTTLVDTFTQGVTGSVAGIRITRGQCMEGYGVQEPYYPVLVALARLLREDTELIPLLEANAPTWLVQFPGLLKPEHRAMLQREILGATRERMLREFCDVVPLISAARPLVLILEDIHWADSATVDLIAAIAQGRGSAQLLLIGTYRPVEIVLSQHPLKTVRQNLAVHRLCQELAIEPLAEAEVAQYLAAPASSRALPKGLAELMHRHSEGNPLFLRAAIDHLVALGHLSVVEGSWRINVPLAEINQEVPESLRLMIEIQVERLSDDQRQALEVGSVCGTSFQTHLAASAAECDLEKFEDICEKLAQHGQILCPAGLQDLPNGVVSRRYRFVHAFYRHAFYGRLPLRRRSRLHLRVGQYLEGQYSNSVDKMASELALHFEQGAGWLKAAKYLQMVADNEGGRFAYHEAASVLEHALQLLINLPAADRIVSEMEVLQKLAPLYFALENSGKAIETFSSLVQRAALRGDTRTEMNALIQMTFPLVRINARQGLEAANRALELSSSEEDPLFRARTRMSAMAERIWVGGWNAQDAEQCRATLAEIRKNADKRVLAVHTTEYAFLQVLSSEYQDAVRNLEESLPVLVESGDIRHRAAQLFLVIGLLFAGRWGQALRAANTMVATAQKNGNRTQEHFLRLFQAWPHLFANDWAGALELCEAVLPFLKGEATYALFRYQALALAGTAEVGLGRYELARKYLSQAREAMNAQAGLLDWYQRLQIDSAFTELALKCGDLAQARLEAQRFLDDSLATAERTWQALAWETQARVSLAGSDPQHARDCIDKALATIDGFVVPVAAWRVYGTAAQLRPEAAKQHRHLFAATVRQLAESLEQFQSVQEAFLSSEMVRANAGVPREARSGNQRVAKA